jgi:selenide,water dikinase
MPGDRLILTKPLGTGIISTAIKGGIASAETAESVTALMAELNRTAAAVIVNYPVHACTDITGFGLIGHLAEMVTESGYGIEIISDKLPIIPEAMEFAAMGLVPAGTYRNRDFREPMTDIASSVDRALQDILFDPQTSGGLLICVESCKADSLLFELKEKGMNAAAIIGSVSQDLGGMITVN